MPRPVFGRTRAHLGHSTSSLPVIVRPRLWAPARLGCGLLFVFSLTPLAAAQVSDPTPAEPDSRAATASPTEGSEIPDVPGISAPAHGFNAGLTLSGFHDSETGWATLVTPALSYAVNRTFRFDTTIPVYMFRLADSLATNPKPNALLVPQRTELGDLVFAGHAEFLPPLFAYQFTGAFTVPTGDSLYGLSTGRVTFDFTNHFERSFGPVTPTLEIGIGDSSALVNRLVNKTYTSLGPLSHYQVGLSVDLPRNLSFETDAYEQLPIGDQKIYGPSRKGRPPLVTGHNVSEDNGFINDLDVPLQSHVTLFAYYSRSLRLHTDSVSIGITFVLRGAPVEDPSTDLLLR